MTTKYCLPDTGTRADQKGRSMKQAWQGITAKWRSKSSSRVMPLRPNPDCRSRQTDVSCHQRKLSCRSDSQSWGKGERGER